MLSISETVKKILCDSSRAEDLVGEFEVSLPERYKRFLIAFIERYEKRDPQRIKTILLVIEICLDALGAALGFFLIYAGANQSVQLVMWVSYIILYAVVSTTIKIIPDDTYKYYLEASKVRLINLSERLAAEVALFNLISQTKVEDDKRVMLKLSERVPDLETLDQNTKSKIAACMNRAKVFTDAREANVVIGEPKIAEEVARQLLDVVRQIVDLCGHLFAGRDFSAKLYLRVIKELDGEEIELLVPFAKFPSTGPDVRGTYGTSWIKARGNPAIVWQCIEKGREIHATQKDFGTYTTYYSTSLAICLPGRIGVLALSARQEDAFDQKYDEWVIKSLAIPVRAIALELLGINE